MNQCIEDLQNLGFSYYKAKFNQFMLRFNPVTGHQLSKQTGICRSGVYDMLNCLIELEAIYITGKAQVKHTTLPYEKFLNTAKGDFERIINSVKKKLKQLYSSSSVVFIYHIQGIKNLCREIFHFIERAWGEQLIELLLPQYEEYKRVLRPAEDQGISI
jgi:sugar-specific transcriptional regulator TrmB